MEIADLYDTACMIKGLIEENQRLKDENVKLKVKLEETINHEIEVLKNNEETYNYIISFMLKVGDKRLNEIKG